MLTSTKTLTMAVAIVAMLSTTATAQTTKLMSFNICHGKSIKGTYDLSKTIAVINDLRPSVIAIQEIDSCTERVNGLDQPKVLAEQTGMHMEFSKGIDYTGGAYGIGVMSRTTPIAVKRVALPGREEARTMVVCEFEKYVFAGTHLSLTEADRLASLSVIVALAKSYNKPFFLAGDLNANYGDKFTRELQKHFHIMSITDGKTFPCDKPNVCIDYIAVFNAHKDTIYCTSKSIIDTKVSDHLPISVTIKDIE